MVLLKQAAIAVMQPDVPERSDTLAEIAWEDGDTPLAVSFGDPYFARGDGRAETQAVFIAGNGLPERWTKRRTFTIGELGFGTGLNFFETLATWRQAPGMTEQISYVSFERYPMARDDLRRALRPWPDLRADMERLLAQWPPAAEAEVLRIAFERMTLEVYLGDAGLRLPMWLGVADAWYLDGFSPAKNVDMWRAQLMRDVYERTAEGGTFSTYTAAGWVRRNLAAAGFKVEKVPGYGRKRERLAGRRIKNGYSM